MIIAWSKVEINTEWGITILGQGKTGEGGGGVPYCYRTLIVSSCHRNLRYIPLNQQ